MNVLKRLIFGKQWDPKDIKDISMILALKKTDIINSEKMDEIIHYKDMYDDTALIMASKHSNPRLVNFLLNKGANVLDKNKDGRSPLIEASMCFELRNFSLAFMPPDEKFIKKMNIKKNYIQIIQILLLHGANINDTDYDGNNAMTYAFNNGHTEVYEALQKWTLILENKWPLAMLMTFLQELIVCHLLDISSFIDFNEYFE